eukprot:TRINITY_DN5820_c0_g1_i3.p3 TRINITY_DN5820_c0_g1~~TRINITY_DN5820_c0_g1_i3.p3  ORF type:complete len:167 (+),score=44.71 TRINITY_DN5820_c0_g1_i3:464-964(+)
MTGAQAALPQLQTAASPSFLLPHAHIKENTHKENTHKEKHKHKAAEKDTVHKSSALLSERKMLVVGADTDPTTEVRVDERRAVVEETRGRGHRRTFSGSIESPSAVEFDPTLHEMCQSDAPVETAAVSALIADELHIRRHSIGAEGRLREGKAKHSLFRFARKSAK